jgi:hypothetical protein
VRTTDALLTIRLPRATRAWIRALAAVTGLALHEIVVTAFADYFARLPRGVQRRVDEIVEARRRHHVA